MFKHKIQGLVEFNDSMQCFTTCLIYGTFISVVISEFFVKVTELESLSKKFDCGNFHFKKYYYGSNVD